MPDRNDLREERFIQAYGLREHSPSCIIRLEGGNGSVDGDGKVE